MDTATDNLMKHLDKVQAELSNADPDAPIVDRRKAARRLARAFKELGVTLAKVEQQ